MKQVSRCQVSRFQSPQLGARAPRAHMESAPLLVTHLLTHSQGTTRNFAKAKSRSNSEKNKLHTANDFQHVILKTQVYAKNTQNTYSQTL